MCADSFIDLIKLMKSIQVQIILYGYKCHLVWTIYVATIILNKIHIASCNEFISPYSTSTANNTLNIKAYNYR